MHYLQVSVRQSPKIRHIRDSVLHTYYLLHSRHEGHHFYRSGPASFGLGTPVLQGLHPQWLRRV